MVTEKDGTGKSYIEIPMVAGRTSVTYLTESWAGEPTIRIQIRKDDGQLHLGPDIPISQVGDLVKATIKLIQ